MAHPEKAFLDLVYIRWRWGTLPVTETIYTDLLKRPRPMAFAGSFHPYVKKTILEYLEK